MDSQLLAAGSRFVVPAGAYASLLAPTPGGQAKAYTFRSLVMPLTLFADGCFNMEQRNTEVYQRSSLRGIVLSSLEGINGTVFMYG